MRISSVRKKSVSLIVVLSFLITLFPMALPAFAADYSRVGSITPVDSDKVVQLNRVKGEFSKGELEVGDEVIISLPSDYEFCDGIPSNNPDGRVQQTTFSDTTKNGVELKYDNDSTTITSEIYKLSDNEIKLVIIGGGDTNGVLSLDDVNMFINLNAVYVDEDADDGDIVLDIDGLTGSGFDDGQITVGRVTEGNVSIEVTEDDTFSTDVDGEVTLRIEEDRAGALEDDAESVKITLPDGFEWSGISSNGVPISNSSADPVWLVSGTASEVSGWTVKTDKDDLILDTSAGSKTVLKPAYIEIQAGIKVEDETDAELGDVIADVGGESDITPSELNLGTYGEYDVTATAADPTTVYAGQTEQEIADITIAEGIGDSLVENRSVTLTLPDWAKWGALDASYNDGSKAKLGTLSFPGKDGQVAKYIVDPTVTGSGKAEIDLEDLEVVLSPDAPEGDLEIEVGGSAGVDATVKVAEVKKPVAVAVDNAPTLVIGKADQAIGTITLTEAEDGLINEGKDIVVELPKDVEWDDYDVDVTAGDLELGDIDDDDNVLTIEVDDESTEASTITISGGTVTAYRTVPEGNVTAKVKGDALIEVNDVDHDSGSYSGKVVDYYDNPVDGYYEISGEPAIEYDEDGLFEDDDTVAKVVAAYVGTPAPGETQIKAVFTLGSKTYKLNDVDQTMDVAPYAKNGRTYLPMRYVAKALGIKDSGILWKNGTATFVTDNKVVSVKIGSQIMTINGAAVSIDAAPEIVSGRTMLPVKWIAAAFGVDVTWDAATQTVTVE